MSYEFSQGTRLMLYKEPYCGQCGKNSNAMLSLHHINSRTSDSPFNGIYLCYKCHDKVTMSKSEQISFIKKTWKNIHDNQPDYKLIENDLDFFKLMAKKWGMTVLQFLKLI